MDKPLPLLVNVVYEWPLAKIERMALSIQYKLTDVGAADACAAWPVSAVLAIEKLSTTTLEVHLQALDNTGDAGHITLAHADTTASATLDCSRALIDEVVATINNDNSDTIEA